MDLQKGVLLCLLFITVQSALPLPPYVTKCTTREQPALNACALENARRTVATIASTGERRYGVPPFDPIHLESLRVEQGAFLLEFTDMIISTDPPGSWSIDDVSLDLEKQFLHIRYSCPSLLLKSKYRLDGRVLVFNLKSSGDCEVRYDNYAVSNMMQFDIVKNDKDGLEYVKLKNPQLDANNTKSTYKFSNIFQGQETLNKAVQDITNNNWKEIDEDTKESTLEAYGQFSMAVFQSFFNSVPHKDIFPQ